MAYLQAMTGTVVYVADPSATATFYQKVGFTVNKNEPDHVSVSLGDYWMDFHPEAKENIPEFQKEALLQPKGAGLFLYFRVSQIDNFYQELLGKGLVISGEPR